MAEVAVEVEERDITHVPIGFPTRPCFLLKGLSLYTPLAPGVAPVEGLDDELAVSARLVGVVLVYPDTSLPSDRVYPWTYVVPDPPVPPYEALPLAPGVARLDDELAGVDLVYPATSLPSDRVYPWTYVVPDPPVPPYEALPLAPGVARLDDELAGVDLVYPATSLPSDRVYPWTYVVPDPPVPPYEALPLAPVVAPVEGLDDELAVSARLVGVDLVYPATSLPSDRVYPWTNVVPDPPVPPYEALPLLALLLPALERDPPPPDPGDERVYPDTYAPLER